LQDARFRAGGPVPNAAKFTLISWTGCSRNIYATHINDVVRSNPASVKHSVLDSRWSSLANELLVQLFIFIFKKPWYVQVPVCEMSVSGLVLLLQTFLCCTIVTVGKECSSWRCHNVSVTFEIPGITK
jgi:hypothetical protein